MNVDENLGHLYPLGDIAEHKTENGDGIKCPCNPVRRKIGDSEVLVHRSYDGREIILPWKTVHYVHTVDVSDEFNPETMSYSNIPGILEYTFANFRKRGTIVCGVSLGRFQIRAYEAHSLLNARFRVTGTTSQRSTVHGVPVYESPLENCVVIHYCLPSSLEDREVK